MIGIGIAVLIGVVAIFLAFSTWVSRYHKVGPEEVLVISGRKREFRKADGTKETVGFRVIRNGGTFVWPVVEKIGRLSLYVMRTEVTTKNAMSEEGVPLEVSGTALFKVGSTEEFIQNAAERYLGRPKEDIIRDVTAVLEGYLRGVCGTLTPEKIYRDRQAFQAMITEQAQAQLAQLGIVLDTLTLREIKDEQGYLDSLGKQRTAEVQRDARMGQANAGQQATVKEAEAKQISETRTAETAAAIASAEKDRDVKKAQYSAEVATERARAEQAGPIESAKAKQEVAAAETELATRNAARREQELLAEVVRPAEAQKRATVTAAEAERDRRRAIAEAVNYEQAQEGKGEAEKILAVATSKAEATRLQGQAEGDAIKAKLLAEAEGIKAKLLAEAEGLEKRAEAMKKYTDAAMQLELGQRFIEGLPAMIEAASKPLAAIDKLEIIDFGGEGGNPTAKLAGIPMKNVLAALEAIKAATGIDPVAVLKGMQAKVTEPAAQTPKATTTTEKKS